MNLYSRLELNVPKIITKDNANFTHIFAGVLEHYRKNFDIGVGLHTTHAGMVPAAKDFFEKRISKKENPIEVLEESLKKESSFVPGCSLVSIPIKYTKLNRWDNIEKDKDWCRARETRFNLKIGKLEISFDRSEWERTFGQIPSACLEVAAKRGFEPVIKIPSFEDRYPNYFDSVSLNYFPEGLSTGKIIINTDVGSHCGKHSTGGDIWVKGGAEECLGDCSNNVDYKVEGFVGSITQARDCNFIIKGIYTFGNKHETNIKKLKEDGCTIKMDFGKGLIDVEEYDVLIK